MVCISTAGDIFFTLPAITDANLCNVVCTGFYLGGVIVTNKQKQLVYEWKQVYETLANVDEVREAALLINSNL